MVFVTGGNGFIGSFIIKKLIEDGQQVTALIRKGADKSLLHEVEASITTVEGDILDMPLLMQVVKSFDVVVHAAAMVSFNKKDKEKINKINVEGTANLVNACLFNHIPKLIFISSVAAIGRNKERIITENNKWEESKFNTAYANSKYISEKEVWRANAEGLETIIVNPSIVLGPGDWEKSSSKLLKYVWDENKFYTSGYINYVDVRDVASAVVLLLKAGISGERFILNGGIISYKEFLNKVAVEFKKKAPSLHLSSGWLSILWRMEFLRALITGKEPLITRETAMMSQKNYYYDNKKIINTLNFNFTGLDETLHWACKKLLEKYQGIN